MVRTRSNPESFPQRVVIVDQKRVLAGDPGWSWDFRHDGLMLTHDRPWQHAASEDRADQALVPEFGAAGISEQSHRVDYRHYRRCAGPAGRPVDLGVGKNRDVAEVGIAIRRAGEDRPVDSMESGIEGMRDRMPSLDRMLDFHADAAQVRKMRGIDREAHWFAVHDRIKGAAKGDVRAHRAGGQRHRQTGVQDEWRNVRERDALNP